MKEVLLVEHHADKPDNDFRLMRLCEWAGKELASFSRLTIGYHPVDWSVVHRRASVVVLLGPLAASAAQIPGALLHTRGYLYPGPGVYFLPTIGPAFIQRGAARWSAAFINDLQKACSVAATGVPPQILSYLLDPLPSEAYDWVRRYRASLDQKGDLPLAFDIETPGKGDDEEDADDSSDAPDRTWNIERISFAYEPLGALSVPWGGPYQAAISLALGSMGEKVVWNERFDVPRIRRAATSIQGVIHDGMVAWHILHSDLPKRLGFVATFTCPWQPAWKHLSGSRPAFYNATDSDVELRSWLSIKAELVRVGLWEVYDRDVVQLNPLLAYMHEVGMPVDLGIRLDRAQRLATHLVDVKRELEEAIPLEARRINHVYKSTPKDVTGLLARPGTRRLRVCAQCGARTPRKDHFKRFVKKVNPCADAGVEERDESVTEYYRLAEFSPSRDQLVRYHGAVKRALPTVWDKKAGTRKVSFGERQVLDLQGRFPLDKVYPLVLQYRTLEKIGGTYIGKPVNGV